LTTWPAELPVSDHVIVPDRSQQLPSERVADDLRARVQRGEWEPGAQIPTTTELAAHYHCSKATVVKAIKMLADEGVLATRPRWGTFVPERH
jgi:DNA-binding GntR family transcriptional regulator